VFVFVFVFVFVCSLLFIGDNMAAYWRRQNLCKICFTFVLP